MLWAKVYKCICHFMASTQNTGDDCGCISARYGRIRGEGTD